MINDSEELIDAASDPKSDPNSNPKVVTYTTNGNIVNKLLIIRFVPNITPVIIGPVNQLIIDTVLVIQDILSPHQTVLPKASVTDAARSGAHISGLPGR